MNKLKDYLLLLGALLCSFTLVSCGGDEADEEDFNKPGSPENPIEESIHIEVKADEHELVDFLPQKLTDWVVSDTQLRLGCNPDYEMPETWVYAYPSEQHHVMGATLSDVPKFAFGFNATGEKRSTTLTIGGVNPAGISTKYHITLVQRPETRSGKMLNLSLTNLLPLNFTFQVYSPNINFEQTHLALEFDNGIRVKPLRCAGHIATLRIEAPEPFQAMMKVHVGSEVYDYGITRVYKNASEWEHFMVGLQNDHLERVDLGKARFQTFNHMGLNTLITQLYDEKFEPCELRCFGASGQEMPSGNAQFNLRYRLSPDVYLGKINRLQWSEDPARLCLASSYAFIDSEKTLKLISGSCYPKEHSVLLRRSTGILYELEDTDVDYKMEYARWVASDDKGDKFYVDDSYSNAKVIGSFTIPKDEYSQGEKIRITPLSNITTAQITNWKAVDDMIYLNRDQIWAKGYVKQIQKPIQPYFVEQYDVSFSSKMILSQCRKRELVDVDENGNGVYGSDLKVADPLSDEWFIYEHWQEGGGKLQIRKYKVYSSFDRTLFVPMIDSENRPDWKGYVMTTFRQVKPFDVSGQLMDEYQNPDLEEIQFSLPFIGNYTYYYNKSTLELYRQQLQPLGNLERIAELPSDKFYVQLSEDGLILVSTEVTADDKVWVMQVHNDGQSELHYFERDLGANIFYCNPL